MNRDDATQLLTDESLSSKDAFELLEHHKPCGVTIEEVVEAVVEYADADDLDIIGRHHFGLIRAGGVAMVNGLGASDPETDACFRARILSHIGPATKATTHVHSWKLYQGFTETYHYCTGCDEKQK